MSQSVHQNSGASTLPVFSPEELARRRRASQRLAWLLGTAALAFYVIGFFLKR